MVKLYIIIILFTYKQNMNQGFQKLTYFTKLIWIDQNPNIELELKKFKFAFGDQLTFYQSPSQAFQLVHCADGEKFLIISSSKIIDEIDVNFSPCSNCFPEYFFFCGSFGRCDYIKKNYPSLVYRAEFHQDKIFQAIYQLQKNLHTLINNSILRPIWVISSENNRSSTMSYNGLFLKSMQYKEYMPVQLLEVKQISKEEHYTVEKNVVFILDRRQGNWQMSFKKVKQQKNKNSKVKKIFIIMEEQEKKVESQQFLQFMKECDQVTLSQLQKSITRFSDELKTI